MTSYTIVCPDSDTPDDVHWARLETFIAGAARAVLDTASHVRDESAEVHAEEYHSPRPGWEVDAIHPDDRERFTGRVTAFFNLHYADLEAFQAELRAAPSVPDYVRSWPDGSWYRAGYLYVFNARGEGIGFWEYGPAGKRLADGARAEWRSFSAVAYPIDHPECQYVTLDEI